MAPSMHFFNMSRVALRHCWQRLWASDCALSASALAPAELAAFAASSFALSTRSSGATKSDCFCRASSRAVSAWIASFSASAIAFRFWKSSRLSCACANGAPKDMKASTTRFIRLNVPFRMRGMRSTSFEVVTDAAAHRIVHVNMAPPSSESPRYRSPHT